MMQNTDIILHSISKYPHFNTLIILEDNKEIVILNYEGISFSSVILLLIHLFCSSNIHWSTRYTKGIAMNYE